MITTQPLDGNPQLGISTASTRHPDSVCLLAWGEEVWPLRAEIVHLTGRDLFAAAAISEMMCGMVALGMTPEEVALFVTTLCPVRGFGHASSVVLYPAVGRIQPGPDESLEEAVERAVAEGVLSHGGSGGLIGNVIVQHDERKAALSADAARELGAKMLQSAAAVVWDQAMETALTATGLDEDARQGVFDAVATAVGGNSAEQGAEAA